MRRPVAVGGWRRGIGKGSQECRRLCFGTRFVVVGWYLAIGPHAPRPGGGGRSQQHWQVRKQAYTVELEAEVSQLKEENMRLRKHQEEEAERRRKQITEILQSATKVAGVEKAKGLRRTRTATW